MALECDYWFYPDPLSWTEYFGTLVGITPRRAACWKPLLNVIMDFLIGMDSRTMIILAVLLSVLFGDCIRQCIRGVMVCIVNGLFRVLRLFRFWLWFRSTRVVLSNDNRDHLESRVNGSVEIPMSRPAYQADVGYYHDSKFCVIGQVTRFPGNILVAPDHVLAKKKDVKKYVKGSQSEVCIDNSTIHVIAADMAAIALENDEFSRIGISTADIAFLPSGGRFVQIVGPDGVGTVGHLQHDPRNFGRVIYNGTTIGGYCGASYADGGKIYGIHEMGGRINGGYNASYLWMLVKQVHNLTNLAIPEAGRDGDYSAKFLESQYETGEELYWQHAGEPGKIQFRARDGRYHMVDSEAMYRAFGNNWHATAGKIQKGKFVVYRDYDDGSIGNELESGEAQASKLPGVSSLAEEQPGQRLPNHQDLMSLYRQLPREQRMKFRASVSCLQQPQRSTNGPANAGVSAN